MSLTKLIRLNVLQKYYNDKTIELVHLKLDFPSEIFPKYMIYNYQNSNFHGIHYNLFLRDQVKFTKILYHTKYVGDFVTNTRGDYYELKTTYSREYY